MPKSPSTSGPMQIILPAGTGQTNGQVLGPSASSRPTPPLPPALPKITPK